MREQRFRYRIKNRKEKGILTFTCRIEDVENRPYHPNPFGSLDFDILSRDEWTGLRDSKGKEIYEGDIINCVNEGISYTLPVEEDEGCFVVKIKHGREEGYWPCLCLTQDREVIGNIYENPDLLA